MDKAAFREALRTAVYWLNTDGRTMVSDLLQNEADILLSEKGDTLVIPESVLYAISDEFHRMEINGYNITERGDAAWRQLTEALTDSAIVRIEKTNAR